MESCTNCGATLRPGAKFCTTCGTRLNAAPASNNGWGTPTTAPADDVQETSVMEAVNPPDPAPAASISGGSGQRERWSFTDADDPASRFISALEQDAKPAEPVQTDEDEEDDDDTPNPATSWVTPLPDTSAWQAPSSWNAVETTTDEPASEEPVVEEPVIEADAEEAVVIEPVDEQETALVVVEETQEIDAAGFSGDGDDEVDYLSGDENIAVSGHDTPVLDPEDARARAITLVDELRRMVRMMRGGGMHDAGAAAMALTEASLNVSDFADLRDVLIEIQDDPRDIQALTNLAKKVDKIELLLDEHDSLAAAIETALKELTGQQ